VLASSSSASTISVQLFATTTLTAAMSAASAMACQLVSARS